tara:strand:+ start:1570 stop:1800 length:231 start_codon:yes stop_codon:yes gene_type:complete
MRDQPIEARINKVEWTLERHADSIKELKNVSKELKSSLFLIHKTLIQIKWFAVGAAVFVVADQMGLMGLLNILGIE